MDRLNQIRGEAGTSRDLTLDTTSPPSEAYMTANESSSKYFSLSEVDSTFSISPSKDSSLTTNSADPDRTITSDADLITNLSPIPKKSDLDSYKIGKQIEAANILSGGVNIFDDNDNSYDGDELVIDDNVMVDEEKGNPELKISENTEPPLEKMENLEAIEDTEAIPSKDTEVVLQIDGKNVDAIDIGNGLYLYRKAGQEELAAVQINSDEQQQPSFKFLKVRENAEGNLEVYEEIEVEIPKEVPTKDGNPAGNTSHVPIKDISKVINEPLSNKVTDKIPKTPKNETNINNDLGLECNVELPSEIKTEVNLNGKMMKFHESRKSPLIGTYTPMTYHSTPNKEGIPLTKTMVDQQLHPSRHSDNIKKTIEVHTDSCRQKLLESPPKIKDLHEVPKIPDTTDIDQENIDNEDGASLIPPKDICQKQPLNESDLKTSDLVDDCESSKEESIVTEKNDTPIMKTVDKSESSIATVNEEKAKECGEEILSTEKNELSNEENNINANTITLQDDNVNSHNETNIPFSNEVDNIKDKDLISDTQLNEDITEGIKTDKEKVFDNIANDIEVQTSEINHIETQLDEKPLTTDSAVSSKDCNKKDETTKAIEDVSINIDVGSEPNIEVKTSNPTLVPETSDANEIINDENQIESHKESSQNNINEIRDCTEHTKTELVRMMKEKESQEVSISENKNGADSMTMIKDNEVITPNAQLDIAKKLEDKLNNISPGEKITISLKDTTSANKPVDTEKKSHLEEEDKSEKEKAKDCKTIDSKEGNNDKCLNSLQKPNPEFVTHLIDTVSQSNTVNSDEKIIESDSCKKPKQANIAMNINKVTCPKSNTDKDKVEIKDDTTKSKVVVVSKPLNNNNSAVPFGKWTSANRQEFLNKIKETKIPTNISNTKQLKQPNDLNRRDVLKKIDSQRQSATGSIKVGDFGKMSKNTKIETAAFVNKNNTHQNTNKPETKITSVKIQPSFVKQKPVVPETKKPPCQEECVDSISAKIPIQRKEINNQDLIDKTIEGIINRAVATKGTAENTGENTDKNIKSSTQASIDEIEMKMNELHGNPYENRASHEMPQMVSNDVKMNTKPEHIQEDKNSKIPNLVPFKNKDPNVKEKEPDELSDEEIIEHEPITGDIDVNKQNLVPLLSNKEKTSNDSKKEAIITEKEFDKFARRNSFTYENCITMSFDGKEPHNVIQTVVEKEPPVKKLSRNELMLAESKAKSTIKQHNIAMRHNNQLSKIPTSIKLANEDDTLNKNYQSKVQIAYQSVLTAKRNLECPISIIEDKPVKVVYMESNMDFTPAQLNVQGQELSPTKKQTPEPSDVHSASESLDSDTLESLNEIKPQDETKFKIKHQRKQVLTPVNEPELELIEPDDLGIEVSPKKKRKLEDKTEKNTKTLVPKKSYLLNRNIIDDEVKKTQDLVKSSPNETLNKSETFKSRTDTISAIDNLVKAAELIETQAENKNAIVQSLDNSQNTPIKRGRGRPRKYPLPEQGIQLKVPSPQKKPRLIDAKVTKNYTDSEDSSDGEIIKENWTMGKINENIVCPICSKLFRSENVVFKHVKHCTGPSPNRSDSDKRSPMRLRHSSDRKSRERSESRSDFTDDDDEEEKIRSRKARHYAQSMNDIDDVIVIEDTPVKEKPEKKLKLKVSEFKKNITKSKLQHNTSNLICEFCGKTFRQLSYLVNHKLQHKKEDMKNAESEITKSVFSCEVCKKDFRKLHHLVQHRIIHNSNPIPTRVLRKSSSEQRDISKSLKNQNEIKQNDDTSAGFRCEPCDKSFRKLHHLVEHRETHDGINKKCTSNAQTSNETTKPSLSHYCDVCKKVFKKLQEYLEHKEQHFETSSEKSDDKSVKSSLSTKDIIHECSLCYMVFPNEHSLNKHTVICLRKKKQSAAKQIAKKTEEEEVIDGDEIKSEENISQDIIDPNKHQEQETSEITKILQEDTDTLEQKLESDDDEKLNVIPDNDNIKELEKKKHTFEPKLSEVELLPEKISSEQPKHNITSVENVTDNSVNIKKPEIKEHVTIVETPTPKKKLPPKDKITPTVTKRHKTVNISLPVVEESKPKVESSDDDEIRYMLNPNFKEDESSEGKLFMKVRAKKRNSLQIERPNSKDLIKRRISLQHPPKIPRLKAKAVEPRPLNSLTVEKKLKLSKPEQLPYTDSDDSDVKYSFPRTKPSEDGASKDIDKKSKKPSLGAKRKSLSGIAKRKSMGKHKLATPTNKTKKRTTEIEHRCDCGQLFSSAALLSRHTTLAHTPPRIRRRRSPPPELETQTPNKSRTNKTKTIVQSKKLRSDVTNSNMTQNLGVGTRKSSINNSEAKIANDVVKTIKSEPSGKKLRSSAHRGVPVPEKMRKLMEKSKK